MLKVEIYDLKNSLIESKTFRFSEIFIGRSKSCDLIMTDPAIGRQHIHLSQKKDGTYTLYSKNKTHDFSSFYELKDAGYIFKFYNIDLISDEKTKDIHIEKGIFSPLILLISMSLILVLNIFIDIYIDFYDTHFTRRILNILILLSITFGLTTGLSLISKAISHYFQFKKLLALHLIALNVFIFIYHDYFGLRWLLPSFGLLNFNEIYLLFSSLAFFIYINNVAKLLFPSTEYKLRRGICFIIYLLCLSPLVFKYIPNQTISRYFTYTVTPPLLQRFESTPVSTENYLEKQKVLFEK